MFAALKLGAAFFLFRPLSQDAFLLHFATHPVWVPGLFDVIKLSLIHISEPTRPAA